jgi:hypothetical protein
MKYDTEWVKKSGEIYPITRGRSIFFEFSQDMNLGKRQLNRFPQSLHIHQPTLKTSLYGDWAWEYTESNLMGWSPYTHGPLMKRLEWPGSSTCVQDEQMACTPCHLTFRHLFTAISLSQSPTPLHKCSWKAYDQKAREAGAWWKILGDGSQTQLRRVQLIPVSYI